jgi:hypothetical protein
MVRGFRVNQYPLVRVIPGLSATRKLSRNGLQGDVGQRSGTIEAHLLEADFWTGAIPGLPSIGHFSKSVIA